VPIWELLRRERKITDASFNNEGVFNNVHNGFHLVETKFINNPTMIVIQEN
jgi:hypothetical protein